MGLIWETAPEVVILLAVAVQAVSWGVYLTAQGLLELRPDWAWWPVWVAMCVAWVGTVPVRVAVWFLRCFQRCGCCDDN
jgi:hypothetical protein